MEKNSAIEAFTALGHPGRLSVFRLLARRAPGSVRPAEMADALAIKHSTLSVYLSALARAGLVLSERDGKSIYYRIDFARLSGLTEFLVADCCRGRPELCAPMAGSFTNSWIERNSAQPLKVLFICRGNSARSIFAEALLRRFGETRFEAFSAGTSPKEEINPHARDVVHKMGHDASSFAPKPLGSFQADDSPELDFVFTVCDRAANEDQPKWRGQPLTAHWSVPDPASLWQDPQERVNGYMIAYQTLERRIAGLVDLPIRDMNRLDLQHALDALGEA
ncbi:MAG: metalloregulator ArsR/SmtB family transcription factor [Pseudomonadota bacterium]